VPSVEAKPIAAETTIQFPEGFQFGQEYATGRGKGTWT
jgi:hypothetical protein